MGEKKLPLLVESPAYVCLLGLRKAPACVNNVFAINFKNNVATHTPFFPTMQTGFMRTLARFDTEILSLRLEVMAVFSGGAMSSSREW